MMENEKKPMKCATCGGKIEGCFMNIRLTVCCAACCEKAKTKEDFYCVSMGNAIKRYHCKREDLRRLDYRTSTNPVDDRFAPMVLYLIGEVRYLGKRRIRLEKKKRAEKDEKEHQTLIKRKQNLLKRLHITVDEFAAEKDRVLWCFLLGDYLKRQRSQTKLRDVKERFAVMPRVQEILQSFPGAHPGAAIDFCLAYPDATPEEFQELKVKIQSVFCNEWLRIFDHLSAAERAKLKNTPLEAEAKEFRSRDSRSLIQKCLVCQVGKELADKIMSYPELQRRIERGGVEYKVAERLLELWNEHHDEEKRRKRLQKAFAARGRSIPQGSHRCQKYISGEKDYDADALVALDIFRARLAKEYGVRSFSYRGVKGQRHLYECLFDLKLSFDESIDKAVVHAMETSVPRRFHDTDGMDTLPHLQEDRMSEGY